MASWRPYPAPTNFPESRARICIYFSSSGSSFPGQKRPTLLFSVGYDNSFIYFIYGCFRLPETFLRSYAADSENDICQNNKGIALSPPPPSSPASAAGSKRGMLFLLLFPRIVFACVFIPLFFLICSTNYDAWNECGDWLEEWFTTASVIKVS